MLTVRDTSRVDEIKGYKFVYSTETGDGILRVTYDLYHDDTRLYFGGFGGRSEDWDDLQGDNNADERR